MKYLIAAMLLFVTSIASSDIMDDFSYLGPAMCGGDGFVLPCRMFQDDTGGVYAVFADEKGISLIQKLATDEKPFENIYVRIEGITL